MGSRFRLKDSNLDQHGLGFDRPRTARLPLAMLLILAALACGGPLDLDEDGVGAIRDCDDADPAVGAAVLSWADQDGDGYGDEAIWAEACPGDVGWVPVAGDCDDADPTEHPQQESCNCERGDLPSRPWYADQDGDGVGEEPELQLSCGAGEESLASVAGDCAPLDPAVYPGATEIWYDGQDQDCAGDSDYDADQDGYESAEHGGLDCDDQAGDTHPGAPEVCDLEQADEDCDGLVNAQDPSARGWTDWYEDQDGDGYGQGDGITACAPASGYAVQSGDCDDDQALVNPGMEEVCGDGVANDCVVTDGECGIHGDGVLSGESLVELPYNSSSNVLLDPVDILGTGEPIFLVGSPFESGGDGYVGTVRVLGDEDSLLRDLLTTGASYSTLGATMVAGDLDQDGQVDLVVTASQHYAGGLYQPAVFLAMGPLALRSSVDELPLIQNGGNSLGSSMAIAGGFLAVNAPNDGRSEGGSGAIFLFDSDPGAVSSPLDAAGELSFDGYYYMGASQLASCDVLGTGQDGLLFGGNFGEEFDAGVAWVDSPESGLTTVTSSDLWVQSTSTEQLGGRISCGDGDEDGYPELWILSPNSGEVLAFDSQSMQQGQDQAWLRVSGGSGDAATRMKVIGDHDGDGYVDLVINDPRGATFGAVSVIYGPLSAGSYTMAQDRMASQTGQWLAGELAGNEDGLLISASTGRSLYWLPSGPGI